MNYSIIISPKAKNSTQVSYDYYETVQLHLGERFLQILEEHYEKLKKHPQHYSYISSRKDLRFLRIHSFPFVIIFEIKNNQVFIIDVHNTHQNLDNILKRL